MTGYDVEYVADSAPGRQVDGAVASLEVLPEIVDAVGDKMTVLFDSGIRTGADVLKALCLGAKAVLVGRPVIYGFSVSGRNGARDVLSGLLADVWQNMALAGIQTVGECGRPMIRKVQYPGDMKAMM
jgi:isopentenyl diphosphate isomerase/L-lactate dehydrogenase-like FMN-dependent dehydrogenase